MIAVPRKAGAANKGISPLTAVCHPAAMKRQMPPIAIPRYQLVRVIDLPL